MLLSLEAAAGLHVVVELVGLGQVIIGRLNLVLLCSPKEIKPTIIVLFRIRIAISATPNLKPLFFFCAFTINLF